MPEFEADGPTMFTSVEFEHHLDEPKPLTVVDVLKRSTMTCLVDRNSDFEIVWHHSEWRIYRGGGLHFQSPDESAACAEFLRLTGGEK